MEPEIGAVYEGKVTGITNFGAFVTLEGGRSGLVHISEVAGSYVNDIHEHLQMGQTVKVRVLNINADGKINLSIKAVDVPERRKQSYGAQTSSSPMRPSRPQPAEEAQDFESRLKKFMQESDSKMADNPIYADHKQRNRHR